MTLNTSLRIFAKVDPEQLWPLASGLAKPDDWEGPAPTPRITAEDGWVTTNNPGGIGYKAWVFMYVNVGAEPGFRYSSPTREEWEKWHAAPGEDQQTWETYVEGFGPPCWVELSWDTAYSYKDELGGCSALHRRITKAVGDWLDAQGIDWLAQDEYTGEWAKTPQPQEH